LEVRFIDHETPAYPRTEWTTGMLKSLTDFTLKRFSPMLVANILCDHEEMARLAFYSEAAFALENGGCRQ
jgi:hypothetical protein